MYKKFREILSSCLVLSALLLSFSYSQSISHLSPDSGEQGQNDLQVYLYASGVNFYDPYNSSYGTPQSVNFSGGGISTNNLQIVNSSTVKFDVDISENAGPTQRDVTLQTYSANYGYNTLYKANAFTVTEHPLNNSYISHINPTEAQQDGQYQISIYASGVNFTDSFSSVYSPFNSLSFSGGGIVILNTQVYSDWIQTTIDVDRFAYTNERDLTVYTDNWTYSVPNALEITPTDDPIEITSISPTEGAQGTNNLLLTIDIANIDFIDNYASPYSIYFSDSDLSVGDKWVLDSNTLAAYVDISPFADVGYYDLTVGASGYNGGQWEYDTFSGFEVTQSNWELVSITPNESHRDVQNLQITLLGENTNWGCCGNPSLSFGGGGINVDVVIVNSSEQLIAQIDISTNASYGNRNVTVTSGDQIVVLQNGFYVKYPEATLTPAEGLPGEAFEVNLIGEGVTFNDPYIGYSTDIYFSGSDLTVSNINFTSENSYTFYLSIEDAAEPGMRDLYINESWAGVNYNFDNVFEVLPILSTIYADPQQVAMGKQNEIPIKLSALDTDQIESVIFAVAVSPAGGSASIEADLDIVISDPNATAMISQGGEGIASVIISGFDPPISGQDIVIGNLLVDIPGEGVSQGDIYHLSTSSVSGSTPDYEGVSMYGIENVELFAVTDPPEFSDIEDVYMLEGTSETVSFTVVDLDGIPLELTYDAPDYVTCSLDYVSGETLHFGSCSIETDMGEQSGMVSLQVTNANTVPEMGNGSFSININHYPVLNISGPIIVPVNENTSTYIELSDSDGDDLALTLLSSPPYTEFNFNSPASGALEISPVDGDSDGEVVFHVTDDGTPGISIDIALQIIVNYAPQFDQYEDAYHVVENDVITAIVLFSDQNGDDISYNVDQIPSYGTYSEIENGLEFTFAPSASDNSSYLEITISAGDMSTSQDANVNVYNTYLAGDVQPSGGENAGDFGDDMLIAPDVVNILRVATSSPGTDIPDSSSSLYDAFDVTPIDLDVNQDGDFYDEGERGGDGHIDVADVWESLKRATMMPGHPNIRRVDVDYPFSTPIDNGGRIANRDDATDALLFGNIEGHPGQTVQVPVTLRRGEGNLNLSGLVSGFSIVGSNDEVPELVSEISFNVEIDGNSMDIPSGNEFLSLLLMDLADLTPNTETLLGTLDFTIPLSANTEDIYYIYTQGSSGTSSSYDVIVFEDNFIGVVPILENLLGDINFDSVLDVLDIVIIINIILPGDEWNDGLPPSEYQLLIADIAGDGVINVLDVVTLINVILSDDLARGEGATEMLLQYGNGNLKYSSDGNIAGIQLEVIGDYTITNNTLPEGWELAYKEGTIIMFSMDGSALESKMLFEYDGNIEIQSAIATDWYGSDIAVSSMLIPKEFALQSAYPNPFNPVTNLKFGLPVDSKVSIQIYNLQGQVVSTLLNDNMRAGYYSVVWNADEFGSGIYFVQMIAGDYIHTQKIMLVK